jgi:DNA-binding MarR family transcriptional regulator
MGKAVERLESRKAKIVRISAQAERMERDLGAIRQALRRPLETEVARGELTAPQKSAMQIVVRNHGVSLKDLSREMSLAHSTVSGIVDRLEKRGLVERKPDGEDGRVSRVYPTAVVTEFVKDRIPALTRGPLAAALERTTTEEREAIGKALKRLRELLERN